MEIKHNLFLFADEAYREFCYEGTHTSAMHLTGVDENVVLMDTISKRYSACGGRIDCDHLWWHHGAYAGDHGNSHGGRRRD